MIFFFLLALTVTLCVQDACVMISYFFLCSRSHCVQDACGMIFLHLLALTVTHCVQGAYDEMQECYHEVHAMSLLDPVLDKQV
jgi:hypothetical protein